MPPKRKFDAVQIAGLALAVAMLIGGNYYLRAEYERKRVAWVQAQEEQQKKDAAAQAQIKNATPPNPGAGQASAGPTPPTPAPAPAPAPGPTPAAPVTDTEPAPAPDVTVSTTELKLVFTAHGAALWKADLAQAHVDPANKSAPTGMELLTEIEPGKRAFGMPKFEIGPPEPERKAERQVLDAADGALKSLDRRVWRLDSNSNGFDANGVWTVSYSTALAQKYTVLKTYTIHQQGYCVELAISVANQSGAPVSYSYSLYGAPGVLLDGPAADPKGGGYVTIVAELGGRDAPPPGQPAGEPEVLPLWPDTAAKGVVEKCSLSKQENLWGGVKNRFYMAMLISMDPRQLIRISAVHIANKPNDPDKRLAEPNIGILGSRNDSEALDAGKTSAGDRYALYLGPSNAPQLEQAEAQLGLPQPVYLPLALQYFDMFSTTWPRVDFVARNMTVVFRALSRVFGNYGIGVILLTVLLKLCLHPLQRKMMVSMSKLQKLQPELKKLQEKYKNRTGAQDKQKMWQEQQDVMKKGGASYGGGCLPMFVQLPILTAVYGIFNRAFEIRGAEFLWIKDLSQADRAFVLPFWPAELNLLPVIYAGLQFLQMRMTPQPKAADSQQEMQQKMMQYMPLVLSLMFYRMPSGLMLYFAASAIFSILETWYIRKFLLPPDQTAATGAVPAKA